MHNPEMTVVKKKHAKTVALFNTVNAGNIGLENFMSQRGALERVIFVIKQSRADALNQLQISYPDSQTPIIAASKFKGNVIFSGVRALMRLGPSVIHAHHAQAALVGTLARCISKSRLVTTAHANFASYKIWHKWAFGIAFSCSDRVICNSEGTKASLPSFVSRNKTSVIYNGVDFSKIDKVLHTAEPQHSDGSIVIGTVCRMVPQKDLPTLLHGFYKARHRSSLPLRLRLVGDGEQRPMVERLIRELDLHGFVEMTGAVSREDVYENLVDMDVFVVSSRWEGFCNAMVEAAAAGKAIIASDIDPLPEVVGRENAIFFEVGDSGALCEHMLMLVADESRRNALANRAREFVRGRYSLAGSAKQYGEVYEALAEELQGEKSDR